MGLELRISTGRREAYVAPVCAGLTQREALPPSQIRAVASQPPDTGRPSPASARQLTPWLLSVRAKHLASLTGRHGTSAPTPHTYGRRWLRREPLGAGCGGTTHRPELSHDHRAGLPVCCAGRTASTENSHRSPAEHRWFPLGLWGSQTKQLGLFCRHCHGRGTATSAATDVAVSHRALNGAILPIEGARTHAPAIST